MPTMVERLLDAADDLLRIRPKSNAARRRAISSAYYAVFHRLAKLCSEELVTGEPRDTDQYSMIYRSLQHGTAKEAFGKPPLSTSTSVLAIGEAFVRLQSEREAADYSPPIPGLFPLIRCQELIDQARKACVAVDELATVDRRSLAVHLLFRARRK